MADKNSYLSRVTYKGGKDSYDFPFSYLRKDFVKAQIEVSEHESNTLAYLVDYTIDGHTIKLTKPVDADKTITIYRETSLTPMVEYEDSSILRAYDLNLSQRQNLNILEEQTDIVEDSLRVATNGGIGYRLPSTAYAVGTIAYHASLPIGWCLKCATGGITGSGDLTIDSPSIGDTITDGGVTWTVVKYALTTDNWTGTVGGGHVAFEDTIVKYFDSKQDQNNDFVFACNTHNAPMFLVSVVTFIYRNTGSTQSIRNFGVLTQLPSGWVYNWLYSKEFHNFINYVGSTYAITAKSAAPLTINVSFKAQSQDTATQTAYTRVWVKKIGE